MVELQFDMAAPDTPPDLRCGADRVQPPATAAANQEVHVWRVPLNRENCELASLFDLLEPWEKERAWRYRFETHRERFIAGRGSLRVILAQYLGEDPKELKFTYSSNGKPALQIGEDESRLQFNLSHSENLALIAVSTGGSLGIDVEHLRPIPDAEELVARFFSRREQREFSALPKGQRTLAFFNLWTRKEALLKATGEGIAHSLHRVEVTFLPEQAAEFLALPEGAAADWHLQELDAAPGFIAALVTREKPELLSYFDWPAGRSAKHYERA